MLRRVTSTSLGNTNFDATTSLSVTFIMSQCYGLTFLRITLECGRVELGEVPMFCMNCGKELVDIPRICPSCGAKPPAGSSFCNACGAPTDPLTEICVKCGLRLGKAEARVISQSSRLVATLLCLFLGQFGVHRFYVGRLGSAVGMLVLGILGWSTLWIFGLGLIFLIPVWIWALIDFIFMVSGDMRDHEGKAIKHCESS